MQELPMNVLLANPRGFCAGVERAIAMVERALEHYGPPIYVRHEVVHNRHVVEGLRARGAVFVEEIAEIPPGAVCLFSAHGVSQAIRHEAQARGLRLFDATCPLVTKVHLEVARHCQADYDVVLIGHRGHPEVEGTMGQCDGVHGRMHLIQSVVDVETLLVRDPERVAYVTQTTLSVDDTQAIIAALRTRFPRLVGPKKSDICYATQNRQDAVRALSATVELILVVGSPTSSNSKRLCELARACGIDAYLVDEPEDVHPEWLAGRARIGVTAGASAPDAVVEQVIARLHALGATMVEEQSGDEERVTFPLPKELLETAPAGTY